MPICLRLIMSSLITRRWACAIAAATVPLALIAHPCSAQSLLRQEPPPPAVDADGNPDQGAELRPVSLFLVEEPKPKDFAIHDKVTIIISETSRQSSQQVLDTKKDASVKASLKDFPDLMKLLEAELTTDNGSPITSVDVSSGQKFKGDGKYERSDRFTDRITATVIDVKPNGVLVIEARRTIQRDKEITTVVVSGECRREDVTAENTVLSTQLADLTLRSTNEGDVKETASKGWITNLFEAIFNF
jgi:flagellar L-ring protein precursor FlgH